MVNTNIVREKSTENNFIENYLRWKRIIKWVQNNTGVKERPASSS